MIDLTTLSDAELGAHLLAVSNEVSRRNANKITETRLSAAVKSAEKQGMAEADIAAALQRVTDQRKAPPPAPPATTPTTTKRV